MTSDQVYQMGFEKRCAQYGVNPRALVKFAQEVPAADTEDDAKARKRKRIRNIILGIAGAGIAGAAGAYGLSHMRKRRPISAKVMNELLMPNYAVSTGDLAQPRPNIIATHDPLKPKQRVVAGLPRVVVPGWGDSQETVQRFFDNYRAGK